MEKEEIDTRFSYHAPKDDQPDRYTMLRNDAKQLATTIDDFCPESREKSLAFTYLEQSLMWAIAAIARRE